jgi:hypothetical protein
LKPLDDRKYKVAYQIITHKDPAKKSENLPLFSRISMRRHMKALRLMQVELPTGSLKIHPLENRERLRSGKWRRSRRAGAKENLVRATRVRSDDEQSPIGKVYVSRSRESRLLRDRSRDEGSGIAFPRHSYRVKSHHVRSSHEACSGFASRDVGLPTRRDVQLAR